MTGNDADREPTPHERAGMAWWNSLTPRERGRWCRIANTCIVAEAYTCYLAMLEAFDGLEKQGIDARRSAFFGEPT